MSGKGKGNAANPKSPGALGSQFQFSAKAVAAAKPKQNKLESTQHKFLALLDALNEEELEEFREFVREELDFPTDNDQITPEMLAALELGEEEKQDPNDAKLVEIIQALRKALPPNALAPEETMTIPKGSHYEGYTIKNTVHVDEFLYTDEEAEELIAAGLLSHNYCADCGSTNIQPLNYISHSLPREVTRWLLAAALPSIKDKVLVDVGSRLGPVLWMGYLFSHAKQLIGIELSKTFAALSQQIVKDFKMSDRVKIIQDNVLNQAEVLQSGDIIVLNNVFEWFTEKEQLRNLWDFVTKNVTKKGAIVVTVPSIEESLANADITDIDIPKWVKPVEVRYPEPRPHDHHHHDHDDGECEHDDEEEGEDPFFENARQVHLYEVL